MSSCVAALLATCWTSTADAREPEGHSLDIAADRLPAALAELSREAGVSIGAEGSLPNLRTRPIHGRMSVAQALDRLLAGSGYRARRVGATAWRIERAPPPAAKPAPAAPVAPADAETESLPIIVTAPKRAAPLDSLPMGVSVVRLNPMRGATPTSGTALVAAESEGLAMTALGPGRNRLFLRGVADSAFTGENQSTVAVVFDETRLTYAAPDPDIRLVDVEQVEVLKGPQGSLYGSGTLGGIYHIVPRRADLAETSLMVAGGGEGVAYGGLGANGSVVANVPVVRDRAALRLVGYAADEPGWLDTGDRKNSNGTQLWGARANLGVEAPDGWRADVSGLLQFTKSHDSRYVYARGTRSRPAQLPEPHDNDMRHLSARLTRPAGALEFTLSSGISWHEVGDTLDATVGAESFGLAAPSVLNQERNYRVWDSEVRVNGKAWGLRWLLGVSHIDARQRDVWTLHSFTGGALTVDDDRRSTSDTALFGDLSVPLIGDLSLDAGARLYHVAAAETRALATGTVKRKRQRTGLTPSFALSWKPAPGELVFLRYASAYRQGASDIGPNGELESLKSDELQTMELGWRRGLGGDGRLDLALYASRWQNVQSDRLLPNGLIESANAGNARIMGAEGTFELALAPRLRMEAGANLTSALLTRTMSGLHLEDRRLPVVPRYTVRGNLTQSVTLGTVEGWLRAGLRYVGPQRLSFDPAIDRPMGAYLESRIEAQARVARLRLSLAVDNIFGGARDGFAFGNALRFATMRQYTPQRPTSVSIGVMADF